MKAAELLYTECENRGFLAEYREQIEYRFTELYYVITLFSYLSGVEKPKLSFVKELREGTERHFPEFDRNKYYLEYTGPEERKFIAMQKRAIFVLSLLQDPAVCMEATGLKGGHGA